jgi:hypothetical protein
MRAVTASLARVAKPRAGVAPRGRSASCPSRRGWRTSSQRVFSSSASDASAREDDAPPPQGVTRLPRERASHGPTYAFGAAGTPEAKGALRLRFLAFHGCGARFTVLLRDRPEPSEAGGDGFVAGELERVGGAGGGGDSGTALSWRFRSAARETKNDGGVREAGVAVPALDAFDGAALKRLALFDGDLGDRRMYAREDGERWSARRAAPSWPREILDALELNGGIAGADALVCVDGGYFLELMRVSAFPTPVLFPHGAWRLRGAGPGVGPRNENSFRAFAEAFRDDMSEPLDAVAALHAAARGALINAGVEVDFFSDDAAKTKTKRVSEVLAATPGRITGEIPSRGRANLGDAGGAAGLDAALDAVSDRVATVRFPDGPLGLGFAPYDWDEGTGAQVWEVDDGSVAARNGVVAGMTFRSMRLAESAETTSCSDASFEDIDAAFDAPRPIEVTFQAKAPNVERLYAVEMRAEHVAGGLQTKKTGGAAESAAEFREPGAAFAAATVWREARATVFVGDAGSGTPPHHDIVAQIELCHVMRGSKMLAAAPWGEPSDELLRRARPGDDDDDDDDEEDESLLTVPTHRALTEPERAILERTPELCVVHARPGGHGGLLLRRRALRRERRRRALRVRVPRRPHPRVRAHARRALRAAGPVLAGGAHGSRVLGAPHGAARADGGNARDGRGRRAARRRERRGARRGGEPAFALGRNRAGRRGGLGGAVPRSRAAHGRGARRGAVRRREGTFRDAFRGGVAGGAANDVFRVTVPRRFVLFNRRRIRSREVTQKKTRSRVLESS